MNALVKQLISEKCSAPKWRLILKKRPAIFVVKAKGELMPIDKFKAAERALKRFETLYGPEILKVFSAANGYISRELTDGMVAGVPQKATLDGKKLWVVPIVLSKKSGVYGEIGTILIDDTTYSILGTTARSEVLQKAEVLLGEEAEAV